MSQIEQPESDLERAKKFISEFDASHESDFSCEQEALGRITKDKPLICNRCNFQQPLPQDLRRKYRCSNCKKEIWITAKTFFDHVRKFRPYLISISLFELGIILSGSELQNLLTITQSTSDLIYKKIAIVVSESMEELATEIPSENLLPIVHRRSTETPANQHPSMEEAIMQKYSDLTPAQDAVSTITEPLSEVQQSIIEILLEDEANEYQLCSKLKLEIPVISSSLTILEHLGLIIQKSSGVYTKNKSNSEFSKRGHQNTSPSTISILNSFFQFVFERFQSISRKCLQLYAALFWIYTDRKRWEKGALMKFCESSRHVKRVEARADVTPLIVNFVAV